MLRYGSDGSEDSPRTSDQVWKDAATQTFFSLGISGGGTTTLCSYNNFHNNMLVDSLVVSLANHVTSIFAGFAIFSILGHMAHIYDKPVSNLVKDGFGLVFIAYPDALTKLAISPLWSTVFTQFTTIEVTVSCLQDAFPDVLKSKRAHLTIAVNVIIFFLGLLWCLCLCLRQAGIYWTILIDHSVASWVMLIMGLIEILGFCYIYGVNCFIKDIEMMLGEKSFCFWLWWRACWFVFSPFIIMGILIWSFIKSVRPSYGNIQYPAWGLAVGWCMVACVLIWIPLVAVYKMSKAEGRFGKRLTSLCSPSEKWRPYLVIHRGERYSEQRSQ